MKKMIWADVGLATEPGHYESRFGLVEVNAADVSVWTKYPNAAFLVMQSSPFSDGRRPLRRIGIEERTLLTHGVWLILGFAEEGIAVGYVWFGT